MVDSIVHCFCVFEFLAYLFVLKLQRWFDVLFGDLIQACSPVEKACAFTCDHGQAWIAVPINPSHRIQIGLSTVCHEPFEVCFWNTILSHNNIQIFPKKSLCCTIFTLHVTTRNGQHIIVSTVVHMANHYRPIFQMFDMVKHDPNFSARIPQPCSAANHHSSALSNVPTRENCREPRSPNCHPFPYPEKSRIQGPLPHNKHQQFPIRLLKPQFPNLNAHTNQFNT